MEPDALREPRSVGAQLTRLERAVEHFVGRAEWRRRVVVIAGEAVLGWHAREAGGKSDLARCIDADVHDHSEGAVLLPLPYRRVIGEAWLAAVARRADVAHRASQEPELSAGRDVAITRL